MQFLCSGYWINMARVISSVLKILSVVVLFWAFQFSKVTVHAGFACDFETGTCDYYQDTGDDFDWTRQNGSTSTVDTGPDIDHTYGNSAGFYLYAEASSAQNGDRARIISSLEAAATTQCVQFYYFMFGDHIGTLRAYARGNSSTTLGDPMFEKSGNQGRGWYRGLVTVPAQTQDEFAEIIFEARMGSGVRSDIVIDDISVINTNGNCPLDSFSCTFDTDMCGVQQDRTDDFNFRRLRGSTGSLNTGQRNDHTTGNGTGHYMYIEASRVKRARLIMPTFRGIQSNDQETFCAVFWYHMYGNRLGELAVYLKNATSTSLGSPLFWVGGDRGDLWRAAEVELNTPEDFNVYFEAARGVGYTSDIAIDDVSITSYACPGHHIVNNVSSVSCDFEEPEICYYEQDDTDDFDWNWKNRGTADGFTGPEYDHTRGDELGFFMYISSTYSQMLSETARLLSPTVTFNSRSSCIEFWYHMYGRDVETLSVYIKPSAGALPSTPTWNITGDQGNYWHRQTIVVPARTPEYRIVFEATAGSRNRDDVAIDDVKLYEGASCPLFTTLPPPSTTLPTISTSLDCDFETDFCNYNQMTQGDELDWARYQETGFGPYSNYGPDNDHTLGSSDGWYASMDPYPYNGARLDDKGIMISPLIAGSSQPRCLTFYAFMYGSNVDYLNLYIRPWGATRPLDPDFWEYGNHAKGWFLLQMDIPPSNENFQILFEGICGRSRLYSELAVDDIVMVDGQCDRGLLTTTSPVTWQANCDFEQDESLCGYTSSGAFNWVRQNGGTGSDLTGPRSDHTYGTPQGHYMYIETSLPSRPGDRAMLESPLLNSGGGGMCMRFYYHAYGADIGTISVSILLVELNLNYLAYSISGEQGDAWTPVNVDLPARIGATNFKICFTGYKGVGPLGDLAIDDIVFLRQPCEGFSTESICTFEQGVEFCNFNIKNNRPAKGWQWFDQLATETAPLDTDLSTSSFVYTKGSSSANGQTSVLNSELHDLLGITHCLTADLVVAGGGTTQKIKIEAVESDVGARHDFGTLAGDLGNEWIRYNWTLPPSLLINPFRFVFTATMDNQGVMAVDNVFLTTQLEACGQYEHVPAQTTPGAPGTGPTTPTTPSNVASRQPITGGSSGIGTVVGIVFAVIIAVGLVVVGVFFVLKCRAGSGGLFSISYKNQSNDDIPFTGRGQDPAIVIAPNDPAN